jgi:Ser/Thr protein kinase RdoA (MazF antagonist)
MSKDDDGKFTAGQGKAVFPVTYSVMSPADVLAEAKRVYRIALPATCRLLRRGLHDTYLISSCGERYIARIYRAGSRSSSDVGYELDLLMHLSQKGVSVSRPIADEEGRLMRLLSAHEGLRPFVVFTYAHGERLSWDEVDTRLAGRLLAQIHSASADFVTTHMRAAADLEHLVDRPMSAIRPFLVHRRSDWAYLAALASRIRAHLADRAHDLDWGVCHGDFGAKNVHIDPHGKLTAFDFDRCGLGWRAFDFALIMWAATGRNRPDMWRSFLAAYLEDRSLSTADLAAMPLFHGLARLGSLALFARHASTWGRKFVDSNLDDNLAFFRLWEAENSAVHSAVQV